MNILFVYALSNKFRMNDVSYIYKSFNNFFLERSPYVTIDGSNNFFHLDDLKNIRNQNIIKAYYFQTRLIDFLYNSDPKNLDCVPFYENMSSISCDKNVNHTKHFFLTNNKFMGMTINVNTFENDDFTTKNLDLFNNIYVSQEKVQKGKSFLNDWNNVNNSGFMEERGCQAENKSFYQNFYYEHSETSKSLFFSANMTKCQALNIAKFEDNMFDTNIQEINAVLYFLNPISRIFFSYSIVFSRELPYG